MFSISNSSLLSHFLISFRMLIELIGNSWALCLKILARTVMESKSVSVLIISCMHHTSSPQVIPQGAMATWQLASVATAQGAEGWGALGGGRCPSSAALPLRATGGRSQLGGPCTA